LQPRKIGGQLFEMLFCGDDERLGLFSPEDTPRDD
jgi:hypothetical protein